MHSEKMPKIIDWLEIENRKHERVENSTDVRQWLNAWIEEVPRRKGLINRLTKGLDGAWTAWGICKSHPGCKQRWKFVTRRVHDMWSTRVS